MEWIPIKYDEAPELLPGKLPKNEVFLAIWRGRICLTQFEEDEYRYYIISDPAIYPQCQAVDHDRFGKFDYWMPLPEMPEEYKQLETKQ